MRTYTYTYKKNIHIQTHACMPYQDASCTVRLLLFPGARSSQPAIAFLSVNMSVSINICDGMRACMSIKLYRCITYSCAYMHTYAYTHTLMYTYTNLQPLIIHANLWQLRGSFLDCRYRLAQLPHNLHVCMYVSYIYIYIYIYTIHIYTYTHIFMCKSTTTKNIYTHLFFPFPVLDFLPHSRCRECHALIRCLHVPVITNACMHAHSFVRNQTMAVLFISCAKRRVWHTYMYASTTSLYSI